MPYDAAVRVVVDLDGITDKAMELADIANAAQIQSFILRSPYIAGLDERSISVLNRNTLERVFDMITAELPTARSLNADYLFNDLYSGRGIMPDRNIAINRIAPFEALSKAKPADIQKSAVQLTSEADYYNWVRRFTDAIKVSKANPASKPASQEVADMEHDLARYLSGRPVSEIKNILMQHEAIAIAQQFGMDGKSWSQQAANAFNRKILAQLSGMGMNVLAFDARMLDGKTMPMASASIRGLANLVKSSNLATTKIVVIKQPGEILADEDELRSIGIVPIEIHPDRVVSEQIKGIEEYKDASISVALVKTENDTMKNVADDLRSYEGRQEKAPTFIVTKLSVDLGIAEITAATALNAALRKTPCFAAIGFTNRDMFRSIQDILGKMNGWFGFIRDVGKAIGDILAAIKQTAVSA